MGWRTAGACLLGMLGGCASYQPKPLDRVGESAPLPAHRGAYDIDAITALALLRNPDLAAQRAARGQSEAAVIAAGVLPNPALSLSYGALLSGPASVGAWSVGMGYDLKSLLTYRYRQRAAAASLRQFGADLLWQEWQVAGRARMLVVDLVEERRQHGVLASLQRRLADRLARTRALLASRQQTATEVATDLSAAADGDRALADLDRDIAAQQQDLALLLGLPPGTVLALALPPLPAPVNDASVRETIDQVAERRPDLVALRWGYAAQEQRLRGAILAQFPALSVGVTAARDTTDVRTVGPDVNVDLPLFDHNQGEVATEQATRDQLYATFTARLAVARSDIAKLAASQRSLDAELTRARAAQAQAAALAPSLDAAVASGDLTEPVAVDLIAQQSQRDQVVIGLEQTVWEQQVALATITGAGLPRVAEGPP